MSHPRKELPLNYITHYQRRSVTTASNLVMQESCRSKVAQFGCKNTILLSKESHNQTLVVCGRHPTIYLALMSAHCNETNRNAPRTDDHSLPSREIYVRRQICVQWASLIDRDPIQLLHMHFELIIGWIVIVNNWSDKEGVRVTVLTHC